MEKPLDRETQLRFLEIACCESVKLCGSIRGDFGQYLETIVGYVFRAYKAEATRKEVQDILDRFDTTNPKK